MIEKLKKKHKLILFGVLFMVGVCLVILPEDFFDTGQSVCLSVVFLDMECYGCGMTRAIQHLIHFDFQKAWEFNMLSVIVFPLFVGLIIFEFIKVIRSKEE
jgi:hypothetical protein